MRILHLTPELPCWPGGTGGATRQFHLLRRLAELGHEVTVASPVAAGEEERRAQLREAGIELVGEGRPASRVAETIAAVRRRRDLIPRAATLPVLAWQVSVMWAALRPLVLAEIAARPPDAITIEHDNAAHWLGDLPGAIPKALVLQNVGPHYYRSRRDAARGLGRVGFDIEIRRFTRQHARWLPRYDALIAVSDRDGAELAPVARRVEVVPNGVASNELQALPPSPEPETLLFTGTLSHPPNSEGIRWFADEVLPQVRARRPGVRLLVVGRDAPIGVRKLGDREGIEFVGKVPDVAPYFRRATTVVVPLLSGGGTRLKILEAFASQRALVSTATGCEGLAVADGRELLMADDAGAFATATLRLLDDARLRDRLSRAGRELAERRYDWRVLGDEFEAALGRLTVRDVPRSTTSAP